MSSTQSQEFKVYIRPMARHRDIPEVLEIEAKSFESPWSEDDFNRCLDQRVCIGKIAEDSNNRIVGFMIYEWDDTRFFLLDFAVKPEYRRRNVGTQMIANLVAELPKRRRTRILVEVRLGNLIAQTFLRRKIWGARGFKAIRILRDFYDGTREDAIFMRYSLVKGGESEDMDFILRDR